MPRFVADVMLGKLARWLRILGYDTLYDRKASDGELIDLATREDRILLTSDRELLRHRKAQKFFVSSARWQDQLREVTAEFGFNRDALFTRCVECNSRLEFIDKEQVKGKVPAYVYETQAEFVGCRICQRIYWAGTHLRGATAELQRLLKGVKDAQRVERR